MQMVSFSLIFEEAGETRIFFLFTFMGGGRKQNFREVIQV